MFSLLVLFSLLAHGEGLPSPDLSLVEVLAKLPVVVLMSPDSFLFGEYSYHQNISRCSVYIKTPPCQGDGCSLKDVGVVLGIRYSLDVHRQYQGIDPTNLTEWLDF